MRKKVYITIVAAGLMSAIVCRHVEAVQCASLQPASDWMCVNGGWLPPNHPLLQTGSPQLQSPVGTPVPTPIVPLLPPGVDQGVNESPQRMSAATLNWHILTGTPVPNGVFQIPVPFVLRDINRLRGSGRTKFVPNRTDSVAIFIYETSVPGDYSLGYPRQQVISDISIECANRSQVGIVLSGGRQLIDRVDVANCNVGLYINWSVNNAIRDSLFSNNNYGILFRGLGLYDWFGTPAALSITTTRLSGVRVAQSQFVGVLIEHGRGIVFDDSSIIEGNHGIGMMVAPWVPVDVSVLLRDVWFEANGLGHISDPHHLIRHEGITGNH